MVLGVLGCTERSAKVEFYLKYGEDIRHHTVVFENESAQKSQWDTSYLVLFENQSAQNEQR